MKTIRVLVTCTLIILAWSWLAGCRTANVPDRAAGTDPTGPYVPVVVRPDTTARLDSVVVTPHRSLVDKVLRRHSTSPTTSYHKSGSIIPQVGKKSTVSIYYGPATVTTNTAAKNATAGTGATGGGKAGAPVAGAGAELTNIEKAKAPVATGTGDATDNTKAGQRGGAAATAPGATATATTIKPPTPWLKYGLWLAAAGGAYWLLFGGGGAVLLALWRRNKSTDSQA